MLSHATDCAYIVARKNAATVGLRCPALCEADDEATEALHSSGYTRRRKEQRMSITGSEADTLDSLPKSLATPGNYDARSKVEPSLLRSDATAPQSTRGSAAGKTFKPVSPTARFESGPRRDPPKTIRPSHFIFRGNRGLHRSVT